jgi:hypothetical protein
MKNCERLTGLDSTSGPTKLDRSCAICIRHREVDP